MGLLQRSNRSWLHLPKRWALRSGAPGLQVVKGWSEHQVLFGGLDLFLHRRLLCCDLHTKREQPSKNDSLYWVKKTVWSCNFDTDSLPKHSKTILCSYSKLTSRFNFRPTLLHGRLVKNQNLLVAGLRVVQHQSSTSVRVWRGQWANASVGKTKTGR